jgi:hypothetical protein
VSQKEAIKFQKSSQTRNLNFVSAFRSNSFDVSFPAKVKMPKVSHNRHRWKESLDEKSVGILESATERLHWSWALDGRYPKCYPINTDTILSEIKTELSPSKVCSSSRGVSVPRGSTKSLLDLIDEHSVRTLYEQQHAESYNEALAIASKGYGAGFASWKKIMNCVTTAYLIGFGGDDFIPKPKVNFLHRELLEIASSLGLNELTAEGLAEFYNDFCPCGKDHNGEAIRKLSKRLTKARSANK